MTDLVPATPRPSATVEYAEHLAQRAQDLIEKSVAASTRTSYRKHWGAFVTWCEKTDTTPLPAEPGTVLAYAAHLADGRHAVSTIDAHLAAMKWHHANARRPFARTEELVNLLAGYARERGRAARTQAQAARTLHIARMVAALDPDDIRDVRDRALILLGFVGAFRRSELVAVRVEHVAESPDGLAVWVPRGKADQEGRGSTKVAPYGDRAETCPVLAYKTWLARSGIREGRVFRAVHQTGAVWGAGLSPQMVARIVKARAKAVGLTDEEGEDLKRVWAGHSLRRGFATEAAAQGVPRHQIMKDGGWTSSAVDVYIEAGTQFKDRAAGRLGL